MPIFTIHVPSEGISQLLSIYLHVQTNRNERLHLGCVLVDHCRVVVIKAERDTRHNQIQCLDYYCSFIVIRPFTHQLHTGTGSTSRESSHCLTLTV